MWLRTFPPLANLNRGCPLDLCTWTPRPPDVGMLKFTGGRMVNVFICSLTQQTRRWRISMAAPGASLRWWALLKLSLSSVVCCAWKWIIAYEVLDYCFLTCAPLNCNISLFFELLCLFFFLNGNQTIKLILQQHHSIRGMLSSTHLFLHYFYILNLLIKWCLNYISFIMLQIHFFFFPKLSATSTTGKPTTSYEAAIFDCMELCNVINNSALSCAVFKLACKCLYSVQFFFCWFDPKKYATCTWRRCTAEISRLYSWSHKNVEKSR